MMNRIFSTWIFLLVISSMAVPSMVNAMAIYSDLDQFLNDLKVPYATLSFDEMESGTRISNHSTVEGITFLYDFEETELMVSDVYDSVSAPNFLGTTDSSVLLDGDDFQLVLEPINAIGIHFITADFMFDNDIAISVGDMSVGLNAAHVQQTLADGSNVYFLGLIDRYQTFTHADISTIGGGFFTYNVDDIVTAKIPTPSISIMMALGLALFPWVRHLSTL